jgi:CheY-like chemotaxis protein
MTVLNSKTILIIEDYEDDAKLLQLLLSNAGIFNPIRIALSAEEAIAYLKGGQPGSDRAAFPLPSVIFVDLKLPGIDGFEFLRWLRAHDDLKGAFIVVLSATGDTISIQTAYALGANSFLVKPCHAADLENLIVRYPGFWGRPIALPKPEIGLAGNLDLRR